MNFWGCFLSLTLPISSEAWKHIVFLANSTWNCLFRWPIKRNFTLNKFEPQKIKLAKCNIEGGGQLQQKCILYNNSVYVWQSFIYILCSSSPETSIIPVFSSLINWGYEFLLRVPLSAIYFGRRKKSWGNRLWNEALWVERFRSWPTPPLSLVGSKVWRGKKDIWTCVTRPRWGLQKIVLRECVKRVYWSDCCSGWWETI